jgi:hypothetical protein
VYKSDERFIDSSDDSVSSSDNEIDDVAIADAVMTTVVMTRKYRTKISCGRLWIITQDTEKYLVVILDPEMVQKM